MTDRDLLNRQLGSFLRNCQSLRGALVDEHFSWPDDLLRTAQAPSFTGFKWSCLCTRDTARYFGIRRLQDEPPFSFMRLAADGFQVSAIHHISYCLGIPTAQSAYFIVELTSADEIRIWDCFDLLPGEWHILDEFVLRRYRDTPEPPVLHSVMRNGPYGVDLARGHWEGH